MGILTQGLFEHVHEEVIHFAIKQLGNETAHDSHDDHDDGHDGRDDHDDHHDDDEHHDGHDDHDERGFCSFKACLRNWKLAFAIALFVQGVVFGYIALLLRRFSSMSTKRFRKIVSLINVFGGGTFLATGLLHILPGALELLSGENHHAEGHDDHDAHQDDRDNHGDDSHEEELKNSTRLFYSVRQHDDQDDHAGHDDNGHGFPVGLSIILGTFLVYLLFDKVLFGGHSHGIDDDEQDHKHDEEEAKEDKTVKKADKDLNGFGTKEFASGLALTLGIGLHSIIESLALGASSRWSTVLNTFIAITSHRWATTMALGARYARGDLNFLSYSLLNVLYAAIAPISILLGLAITNAAPEVLGAIFAVSSGTFLYAGAFETPAGEFIENPRFPALKFLLFFAGAAVIFIITIIISATGIH